MNTTTAPSSPRQTQSTSQPPNSWKAHVRQLLSAESADQDPTTNEWAFLHFDEDRAFLKELYGESGFEIIHSDASQPRSVLLILSNPSDKSWLAVPLGPEPTSGSSQTIDSNTVQERIEQAQAVWELLPQKTLASDNLHEEIKQFAQNLTHGHIASIDQSQWWFIPLGQFRLVYQLVHMFGLPPSEIQRDWQYQCDKRPPSLYAVVSPTGWLIDLENLIQSIRPDAVAPTSKQSLVMPPLTPRPPRRRRSPWTSTRIAWVGSACGLLLLVCAIFYWSQSATRPASPQSAPDSIAAEVAEVPIEVSDETTEELTTVDTQHESISMESMSLDSISLGSMPLESITLESISNAEPMGAPKFDMDLGNSDDTNEPIADDSVPGVIDANVSTEDIEQPLNITELAKTQVLTESIGFEKWGQRREVRFGRGAHAKNGWCVAHLRLGEAAAEKEKTWLVTPSDPQGIQGDGVCEWRVNKEESDVELVVRAFSKPGTRWQLVVLVGARTAFGAEPVSVAPGQASAVLLKLQGHLRWLQQTQEAWQSAPRPPRIRGMPDAASYTSWLRAQEKETAKAIEQWTRIAELTDVLQASGVLEYELSIASPTEPSPPATSPPAPGKAD